MKKLATLLTAITMTFSGLTFFPAPVFADCVPTAILGDGNQVCDNGDGSSIYDILNLVVDILSVGVGVLGVIGITLVGTQYLTAGGSEEKTRKAKRRMFEIIIGLVAYVLLYAALKWLLPNFNGVNPPTGS